MEKYRSGHNELHSKCSCRVFGTWVRIPSSPPRKPKPIFWLRFFLNKLDLNPSGSVAFDGLPLTDIVLRFIAVSHLPRQSELRSHTQFFYFCLKGIPAIIIPTIKFVPKQSLHYLNLKRDKHGNWIK